MEKALANINKQDKKDLKRLEKIEKAGFTEQNQYLISKGYEKLSDNLKALRKSKGNQEEAIKILESKQKKKMSKAQSLEEKVKSLNLEPQMSYLVAQGFKNIKKNLKYLTLYKGDQEKTKLHLSHSKNKKNLEEEIKAFGYEKENKILMEKGFSNLKRNLKNLQLYEGKVERVLDHYNHNKEHKYEQLLKLVEDKGLSTQNTLLVEKGFTKIRKNLKLLMKHKGDVSRVFEAYSTKKEQKLHDYNLMCKTHGVQASFENLVLKGHKPKKILKLFKIYNWDSEKTTNHLESSKQKQKGFEAQIKDLGFEEQNKALLEKGFKHLKKNLKLLQLFNGNLDLVLAAYKSKSKKGEKIDKKLAELNFSAQYKQLMEKDGTRKPKKVLKALIKYNGDVKEAEAHLDRKKLHKEYSVSEWNPQIHTLFLDGNNIMFANDNIRKLYLLKKKKEAEELLKVIVRGFSIQKKVEKTILLFDRGAQPIHSEEIPIAENLKTILEIRCCQNQKSADDELVDLVGAMNEAKNSLVVTADLELRRRLIEKGVKMLMGPKEWFAEAKRTLGPDYDKI